MLKEIAEFIPVPVVAGVALFAGFAWMVTPSLQARHIEKLGFMDKCVSGVRSENAKLAARLRVPNAEGQIMGQLNSYTQRLYGHGKPNPLSLFGLDKMMRIAEAQKRQRSESEIARKTVNPEQHCKCLVSKTKSETRQAYMWWVSSMAFVEEIGVGKSFYDVLTGLDKNGVCGKKA